MSDPDQEQARRLVRAAMSETGLELTPLAKAAGVSHTTLTRFMNDLTVTFVLSTRTTNKIIVAVSRIRLAKAAGLAIEPPKAPKAPKAPRQRRSSPAPKRGERR